MSEWISYEVPYPEDLLTWAERIKQAAEELASKEWVPVPESYEPQKGERIKFRFVSQPLPAEILAKIVNVLLGWEFRSKAEEEIAKSGFSVEYIDSYVQDSSIVVEGIAVADPPAPVALILVAVVEAIKFLGIIVIATVAAWAIKEYFSYKKDVAEAAKEAAEAAAEIAQQAAQLPPDDPQRAQLLQQALSLLQQAQQQLKQAQAAPSPLDQLVKIAAFGVGALIAIELVRALRGR